MAIATDRPVNAGQLSVELGRVAVHVVGPDAEGISLVDADTDPQTLEAALLAHVADPQWVDPAPPPPSEPETPEARARVRLRALKAKGWANLSAAERAEVAQRLLESI